MGFQAAKCSQCGGALQVPDDRDFVKCMYCGVDVKVRDAIQLQITQTQGDPKNLLALGQVAADGGNHAEAYKYFSRVIEIEPTNADAWRKMGTSAGWQSNLKSLRFAEMIECHQKAIEFAANESYRDVVKMMSAMDQLLVARALFESSTNHTIQFIAVPSAKFEHVDRCREIIKLCEHSAMLYGEDLEAARIIVDIARRFKTLGGISVDDRSYFELVRIKYQNKLGAIDKKTTQESSGCFVITATMGDANHPHVLNLRKFREQVLAKTKLGQTFIQWYAKNGPRLAKRIEPSLMARVISYLLIVVPCSVIALIALRVLNILFAPRR